MADLNFPNNPIGGDQWVDPNDITWVFSGKAWYQKTAIAPAYIDELLDVDVSTTAPTDRSVLLFNTTTNRWEPENASPKPSFLATLTTQFNHDVGATSTNPVPFNTVSFGDYTYAFDTHSKFDVVNFSYVIPITGKYHFDCNLTTINQSSLGSYAQFVINTVAQTRTVQYSSGVSDTELQSYSLSTTMNLNVDDTIEVELYVKNDTTWSISTDSTFHGFML